MKKSILFVFCIAILSGCQKNINSDYQFGYTNASYQNNWRYNGDSNPYWGNNYRLNSSNYSGNQNYSRPEMYY